jgi:hypothetical protein
MTSPEQLKLLSEEVEREGTPWLFAEFKQWCRGLKAPRTSTPLSNPTLGFVGLLNETVDGFEETEGPSWRRELKEAGMSHGDYVELLVFLRFLQCLVATVEYLHPLVRPNALHSALQAVHSAQETAHRSDGSRRTDRLEEAEGAHTAEGREGVRSGEC